MTEAVGDPKFEALLDYIQRSRGIDFTGYKRSSLIRRFQKRMLEVGVNDFVDYMDYIEVHPKEFGALFNTILINVTAFFRDPASWEYLSKEVIPAILTHKGPREQLRIWCAGCASGEEAYTIAILMCEALGVDQFQQRVKIYATDVDEEALGHARQALYNPEELADIDPDLRSKYFTPFGARFAFRSDLRRSILFGRHDLVQDAPISHLDLLICRNTLMYLNAETQRSIVSKFRFALNDHGFLFVGKSEMLLSNSHLFEQTDSKHRIFSKLPRATNRVNSPALTHTDSEFYNHLPKHAQMKELCLETAPVAQILVDLEGKVAAANQRARQIFSLSTADIGRPLKDLELSYRPIELRSLIDQALQDKHPVKVSKIERHQPGGHVQLLDLEVVPLFDAVDGCLGVAIVFNDITSFQKVYDDLEQANQELETTNEELQSAHEELETTNEELQSTNEELETTNEELQSTNEELETINEELQSTNEELETTNAELRRLTAELNQSNSFLNSILSSLQAAVIVLDREGRVLVWNDRSEDLWGLRAHEVQGKPFLSLDIGLPVAELAVPIQKVIVGSEPHVQVDLKATNRRGKAVQCSINITPHRTEERVIHGIVMVLSDKEC